MKKIVFGLLAAIISLNAQVTLPHYEGFDYTVGADLGLQTGWSVVSANTDKVLVADGNLSYTGLPASTGKKIAFTASGEDVGKAFTAQTTGKIYYSFLINVTSTEGAVEPLGGYFAGLLPTGSTSTFGSCVWLKRESETTYFIGLSPRTSTTTTQFSSSMNINTTHLVVVCYEIVGGTGNDVVSLWIDPTPGAAQNTPTLTATNTGGTDLVDLSKIFIRQDSITETPATEIDELRIGTTWADVTPGGSSINNTAEKSNIVITNFPNPFNPTTAISFNLPQALNGQLAVYNAMGEKVAELFSGAFKAGVNSYNFNAADLNSGVYYCKLTAGTQSYTQKMVLTK